MGIIYGKTINGIISTGSQVLTLSGTNGIIRLTLNYKPAIQMWFMDINYNNKIINGIKICLSTNILRQWKNYLDFRIMIKGNEEPMFINDFSSGKISIWILDSSEVQVIEDYYSAGV